MILFWIGAGMNPDSVKLKLKLPSGAEFEAEGGREFVAAEKDSFLAIAKECGGPAGIQRNEAPEVGKTIAIWQKIAGIRDNSIILKAKAPDPADAALIIAAIAQISAGISPYSSLELSKSLKKSGYFRGRIDRLVAGEIRNGRITATGTKRNRAYQLTPKGLARAFVAASKLANELPD